MKIIHKTLSLVAVLFGLLTVFAGTRVLLGSDPGYTVFRPLLVYNTVMGLVYIAAGIIAWSNLKRGISFATTIFVINLLVLIAIYFLHKQGDSVAVDSLYAMSLRTFVWLVLSSGFWLLNRKTNMQ